MKEKYLLEKYKLPYYIKGKSFSDAAKSISKKFKGRNDAVSLKTKKELLDRLKMAQEEIRGEKLSDEENQFLLGGLMDALGGNQNIANSADPKGDAKVGADAFVSEMLEGAQTGMAGGLPGIIAGAGAGLVSAGIGAITGNAAATKAENKLARKASNAANEQYAMGGPVDPPGKKLTAEDKNILRTDNPLQLEIASGAEGDALMDRLFVKREPVKKASVDLGKYKDVGYFDFDPSDPTGTTLIRGKGQIHNADAVKRQFGNIQKLNPGLKLKYNQEYKYGGMPKMDLSNVNAFLFGSLTGDGDGGWNPDPMPKAKLLDFVAPAKGFDFQGNDTFSPVEIKEPLKMYEKPSFGNQLMDFLKSDQFKSGANSLLRGAPAIGNAIQMATMEPADPVRLDRMDMTYKPRYTDEAAYVNRVNNNIGNLTEGIQDSSAGDIGAIRSNLLAAYLKKNQMISDAARQAEVDNRAEDKTAADFAFNKGQVNIRQSNLEQDMNDANEGAYTTARSTMGSALANDIGNIGLERQRMDYARRMGLLYDSNGKYIGRYDKATGRFITAAEEPEPQIDETNG